MQHHSDHDRSVEFNPRREPTVAIVGVGLIGGSIAAGLKKRRLTDRVIGVGRNLDRLRSAQDIGLIDVATTNLVDAAAESNVIVFCQPVELIVEGVRAAAAHCRPGTLLTDVGSVKASICRGLSNGLPDGVTFIGSHPLAGSERQGFEHADADLFDGRVCVVTPAGRMASTERDRLARFWQALGSTVVEMSADEHDQALSQTSHLPHVVASALAATLSDAYRPLAASGFRDTTRIAAGDPDLWVGILLENAAAVVESLGAYAGRLEEFRAAIARRDAAALKKLLEIGKTNRDALNCQ